MNELIRFLRNRTSNAWITVGSYAIYLRHGHHYINDDIILTLDIANIENTDEDNRGRGGFKNLLTEIERLLKESEGLRGSIKGIYIESVLNERLKLALPNLGFELVPRTIPESFFKPVL